MKINDVLECFNKVIDINGNPNKIHYVAHSTIDKLIGQVKKATTIITLCNLSNEDRKEIIKEEYTATIPTGYESALIEESERRALLEFIKEWSYDKGTTG